MRAIAVICLLLTALQPVFAHPPKSVDVTRSGDKIEVDVLHPVADPKDHYINRITVSVNGKPVIEQKFPEQNAAKQHSYYYVPFLKTGDKINVTAFCNKFGDLSREITVK